MSNLVANSLQGSRWRRIGRLGRKAEMTMTMNPHFDNPATCDELNVGLSSADQQRLGRERSRFLRELASTREGRGVLRRCHPHVDITASALKSAVEELASEMASADQGQATAAAAAIWDIHEAAQSAAMSEHYRPYTRLYRQARSVHAWMDEKVRHRKNPVAAERYQRLADIWGWAGSGFSLAAAAAIVTGHLTLAGIFLAVRIFLTALCWFRIAYPGDDSPDKPVLDSDTRICVLGHAGDMTLMAAFGIYLMNDAHWTAGAIVWGASLLMILGTVFRIASRAPRLHVERMMRGGSICAAVFLLAWSWEAAALGIMIGPIGFAAIEAGEAWKAMSDRSTGPGATIQAVTLSKAIDASKASTGETPIVI